MRKYLNGNWKSHVCTATLVAVILAAASGAASAEDSGDGVLNPNEYTYEGVLQKVVHRQISELECIYGYEFAKHGRHADARVILNYCAEERRLTQAMTMLSWMDENGYAIDRPNFVSAAVWDRRAADLGDANAQLNYGLKLLRGVGVRQDLAKGQVYIDRAAANGDEVAKQLAAQNYDYSDIAGIAHDRGEKGQARLSSMNAD